MCKNFSSNTAWIGVDWKTDAAPLINRYYAFRKRFCLDAAVKSAAIKISSRAFYRLWINNKLVLDGPSRCYPEYQSYDMFDVSGFLHKGDNFIAVLAHHPGKSLHTFVNRLRPGVIVQLNFELEDGKRGSVNSNASWQARHAEWYKPVNAMISLSYGFQEQVNSLLEPAGWRTFEDDESKWSTAWPYGPANIYPVVCMQPRNIDYLVEDEISKQVVFEGFFIPPPCSEILGDNLRIKFEKSRIISKKLPFIKKKDNSITIKEKSSYPIIITYDLGQTMPFRIVFSLEFESVKAIQRVEFYYDQALSEDGKPLCGKSFNSIDEGQADSFIPSGQNSYFRTFGIRGGRFVTLVIYSSGKACLNFSVRQVHYPVKNSAFSCSDKLISQIFDVSKKTLITCMLDSYVDCCTREQTLWAYDACVQGVAGFYTFGDLSLFRRSLEIVGQSSMPDGNLRNMGPAEANFMFLNDQVMTWVIALYEYYFFSADKQFLKEMEEPLFGFLSYCERHIGKDGLFIPPWGTWHWIDWTKLDKRPHSLSVNALLLVAAFNAGRIARVIKSERLSILAKRISKILKNKLLLFYNKKEKVFLEHYEPELDSNFPHNNPNLLPNGWPSKFEKKEPGKCSLHGNVLMLLAGILQPDLLKKQVKDNVLNAILKILNAPPGDANKFGPGWSDKIFGVLFEYGLADEGFSLLKRYYGDELKTGAPTWVEEFRRGTPYNTAHGWGACVNTLIMRYVLGAVPLAPGWKQFTVIPKVKEVENAEGIIHTPHGKIHISWKRKNRKIIIDVKCPAETAYIK